VENHKETHRLSTKGFKNWLKYRFFSQYGKVPGTQAVQDAAGALEGKALFAGPEHETHVRVAGHIDSVYLDLCNSEWEVVEVTPEGWRIVSGEEAMLEAYREDKDLHTMTARSITGKEEVSEEERKLAKAANFGLLYGQGAEGLRNYARNSYGVEMSLSQAERYRERFFKAYPAIRSWHRKEGKSFGSRDNAARSLTGRMRRVGRFTEKINAPVQGTAADGMKMALALLWERRHERPGAVPILAVHDEIVVECDEGDADKAEAWLKKAMEDGMDAVVNITKPYVPIQVETSVSQAWGD
jgi:DNA polymerase-1